MAGIRRIWLGAGLVILGADLYPTPGAPAEVTLSTPTVSLGNMWLLNSDPAHSSLSVNVAFTLKRNQPAGQLRNIPIQVSFRLVEASGGSAVVGSVSQTEIVPVPPVTASLPVSLNLRISPESILSQGKTYSLRLTVSHDDDPPSRNFRVDHTMTDGPHSIAHFSGQLLFGRIATTLNTLSSPPLLLPSRQWRLAVSQGTLSRGITYLNVPPATSTLDVERDDATGHATARAGSVLVTPPQNPIEVGGWTVQLGPVLMDANGIQAQFFRLSLPEGTGWRLDDDQASTPQTLNPIFSSENVPLVLDQNLQPAAAPSGTFAVPREFVDERLAVGFIGAKWSWNFRELNIAQPATRFQRQWHYDQWKSIKGDPPDSNDGYLALLAPEAVGDLVIRPGLSGGFQAQLTLNAGSFSTHFPHGVVAHTGGTLRLADSMTDPGVSALNVATAWILTHTGCRSPEDPYALPDLATREAVQVGPGTIRFTAQGSLWTEGVPQADPNPDDDLKIVRRAAAGLDAASHQPVHETSNYTTHHVQVLIPAPLVPAADGLDHPDDGNTQVDERGEHPNEFNPARWLYTGLRPQENDALEHPATAGYLAGAGDYAGVNFRHFPGLTGTSRVGGGVMGPYSLQPCQKLYARASGATGRWVADPSGLPSSVQVGGPVPFTFNLDAWAFQLLGNEPRFEHSAVAGSVSLPYPANFSPAFEAVEFTCCGNLDKVSLAQGESVKTMTYWGDARIAIQSARFVSAAECSMEDSALELHVRARANGLPDDLDGFLRFRGNGRMTTGLDPALGASALHLHAGSPLAGDYYINPVRHAYYNDPGPVSAPSPIVPGDGFISVAGLLDLAFFQAMESHAVLTGRELSAGGNPDLISGLQGGWKQPGGGTFFSHANFDAAHRGLPPGIHAPFAYVSSLEESLLPRARRTWFGLVPFDFPVVYDPPTRHFHSVAKKHVNVIIAQAEADVPRLNYREAAIDFGATLGLSLNNLFAQALSFVTGQALDGFSDLTGVPLSAVAQGLEDLDQLLSLQASDALREAVLPRLDNGIIQAAATQLKSGAGVNNALNQIAFSAGLQNLVASDVAAFVGGKLAPIAAGLDAFIAFLSGDSQNTVLAPFMIDVMEFFNVPPGLQTLTVPEMIDLAGLDGGPLRERLDEVIARMEELRGLVQNVTGLNAELLALLTAGNAGFGGLQTEVRNALQEYFETVYADRPAYTVAEIEARIRAELEARLWAMPVMNNVQTVLRSRFYHFDHLIKQVFASALDQINREIGRIVADVVDLDEILGELTGLGNYVRAASLKGQAVITGDDLTYLSLKAHTVIHTQPIPLNFDPFYEYQQLHADGARGCDKTITPAIVNRITMGATVSPATFTFGEISVTVATQFSFTEGGKIIGFMGGFETIQEGLQMQPVNFDRINALLNIGGNAFGQHNLEFYLAAEGQATLFGDPSPIQLPWTNFKLHGGIFAGRTCTDAPYSAWAPTALLPAPPFLGAIAAVDGKFPFYDIGCLLRLKTGAGVGGWFVIPGHPDDYETVGFSIGTFLKGHVSGDFLCLISGKGSIELAGTASQNYAAFNGSIEASLKAGPCPFCAKFNASLSVHLDTQNGASVDF